jgi:hypothetical protein
MVIVQVEVAAKLNISLIILNVSVIANVTDTEKNGPMCYQ